MGNGLRQEIGEQEVGVVAEREGKILGNSEVEELERWQVA